MGRILPAFVALLLGASMTLGVVAPASAWIRTCAAPAASVTTVSVDVAGSAGLLVRIEYAP